jgi:hypothetical protein
VTDRTALYRVYDDVGVLLYIGVSGNFGVRWQKHAATKPWWGNVRSQTIYWYDSRDEALDAEALAIFREQPKYNIMHRSQARRLQAVQRRLRALPMNQRITDRPGLMRELEEARSRFDPHGREPLRDADGYYTPYAVGLMLSTALDGADES